MPGWTKAVQAKEILSPANVGIPGVPSISFAGTIRLYGNSHAQLAWFMRIVREMRLLLSSADRLQIERLARILSVAGIRTHVRSAGWDKPRAKVQQGASCG
jgi:hypothetical protein